MRKLPDISNEIFKRAQWTVALALSITVVAMLSIRATHAGALWRDEAATLQLAQMPTLTDVAANFQHEAFPPPFPLTIRGYTALFGATDTSLRLFGFLVGVAFVAVAWFNSRAIADHSPVLVLALIGLNTNFLTWGTTVRGYGLGSVLLLLTLGLTVRAVTRPRATIACAAVGAAIASVHCLVNAVPVIAAMALSTFLVMAALRRWRRAIVVCFSTAICALSFAPYLKSYLANDWNIVMTYPATFSSLADKLRLTLEAQGSFMAALSYEIVPLILIAGTWRLWSLRRQKASVEFRLLLLLTIFGGLSILAYCAFLRLLSYPTQPWYYLALLAALAGAVDLVAGILARATCLRVAQLVLAIPALILLPFTLSRHINDRLTNIDSVAQTLQERVAAGDLVVVNPWYFAPSFFRYYEGLAQWITVPVLNERRIHRYDLVKSKMLGADPLREVRSAVRQTLESGNRVWIVGGARPPEENLPISIQPAPDPQFGWSAQAYSNIWSLQLGDFLGRHVLLGAVVISPANDVSEIENVPLLVAQGWRD